MGQARERQTMNSLTSSSLDAIASLRLTTSRPHEISVVLRDNGTSAFALDGQSFEAAQLIASVVLPLSKILRLSRVRNRRMLLGDVMTRVGVCHGASDVSQIRTFDVGCRSL